MLYDVHLHLDLFSDKEIKEIVKSQRVEFVIVNSVDLNSALKIIEINKKYPDFVKVALGLYPQDALSKETKSIKKDSFEEIKKLILTNKDKIVAIGEIGMDFSSSPKENFREQEKLFRQQLNLAKELNLPVIIHTRKAEKEIIEILKDYPSLKRVLHCFCGNMKLVKSASEIGCYFSIPASIVRMENFQRLIEIVPKERILTETDAPYLSPFRGEKNKPENISETIKMLAKIWNLKEFEVEKIIEQNVRDIFIEIFK